MSETVSQLLGAVGAYVDQSTDLPTDDELTSRISYLDQSQKEWAGAYDWDILHRTSVIPFALSGVSVGLDPMFKKLESPVTDVSILNQPFQYIEINPADRFKKGPTDKYVYILGDVVTGKYLTLNPAMTSNVSLQYDWLAFPTSLATLTDISSCPNPEFLVKRTIAFVLESRSDSRFPQVKADTQVLLNRMIADQDTGSGGRQNRISTMLDGKYVIGE